MEEEKIYRYICFRCEKAFPLSEIFFGPDPYAQELFDDNTDVWLCSECCRESANDI